MENGKSAITCAPDIKRLFTKINYLGWHENTVESMYLKPLNISFMQLQKRLCNMYYKSTDYWKIPLFHNEELLEDIKNLINSELIAERLIGN